MIRALSAAGSDGRKGDTVRVLANGPEAMLSAERMIGDYAEVVSARYGDIWLRDIGPIFLAADRCLSFGFNGWGSKFVYEYDDEVAGFIANLSGAKSAGFAHILEGGALDWDGEGTILTTRECLLNPNRNDWSQAEAETFLHDALGAQKVVWIERGLANDHTDGHVDNVARFIAPGVVVCQSPSGADDPNTEALAAIAATLRSTRDARGRMLQVIEIPSPGRVIGEDGEVAPASHMNFLIGDATVVVPTYGTSSAGLAVERLKPLFQGRSVVGLSARHILSGGGAFHCITQQQPA